MDIGEYEYEMNEIISKQKEHEQDIKYHEHLREKALLEVIDEQEKIINAMAKDIYTTDLYENICTKNKSIDDCYVNNFTEENSACIECIKQYYEKKVSEE